MKKLQINAGTEVADLKSGQLPGNTVVTVVYDGTHFLVAAIGSVSVEFRTVLYSTPSYSMGNTLGSEITLSNNIADYDLIGIQATESSGLRTVLNLYDAAILDGLPLNGTTGSDTYVSGFAGQTPAGYGAIISKTAANKIKLQKVTFGSTYYTPITIYGYKLRGNTYGLGGADDGGSGYTLIEASDVGGNANNITLSPDNVPSAYTDGLGYTFPVQATNTALVTVKVGALTAAKLLDSDGTTELKAGRLRDGDYIDIVFAGTNFILMGRSGLVTRDDVNGSVVTTADDASSSVIHSMAETTFNSLPQNQIVAGTLYFLT